MLNRAYTGSDRHTIPVAVIGNRERGAAAIDV